MGNYEVKSVFHLGHYFFIGKDKLSICLFLLVLDKGFFETDAKFAKAEDSQKSIGLWFSCFIKVSGFSIV